MESVEKIQKEIGFKFGDTLSVDQMTELLNRKLDNERLLEMSGMIKNFAPIASSALKALADTAIASGKVDEAIAQGLQQAIIELGRFHADENVEIRKFAVEKIFEIRNDLMKIFETSNERSGWITAGIFGLVMTVISVAIGGRSRIA